MPAKGRSCAPAAPLLVVAAPDAAVPVVVEEPLWVPVDAPEEAGDVAVEAPDEPGG